MEHRSIGTVVKAEGGRVWVQTVRESSCTGCAAKGACGTSVLDVLFSGRNAPIELDNTIGAREGERVVLVMEEGVLLRQSFYAYGLPLAGFFIGALALHGQPEWLQLAGALVGMGAGWWWVRHRAPVRQPRLERFDMNEGVFHEVD